MRVLLVVAVALLLATSTEAGEQYTGYLTLGCGDRFIKLHEVARPWFVNLNDDQERQIFQLAKVTRGTYPWITLHVVLVATPRHLPRRGYFTDHPQQLEVERVVAARFTNPWESIEAAIGPAQAFKGLLLVGPESVGFVPLEQRDEFWWVGPGKVGWDGIYAHFQPRPDLNKHARLDTALVEIVGRVGPPGVYGSDSNREIAVDGFKYIRRATLDDMRGTAAIDGEVSVGINLCKPQRR